MTAGVRGTAGLLLAVGAATPVAGQEWRTLESSRQLREQGAATVRVEYAAGTLELVPTSDAVLYRVKLRYDAERTTPVATFDAADRVVTIGTRSAARSTWRSGVREGSTLRAELSRTVPMRLHLALGASRGEIALGGLRLSDLSLKAGASETRVDFASPNPEGIGMFDLDVGAAYVAVRHGGNARAQRVHVNVGAGELDYDLAGDWEGAVEMTVNVAVGAMTLRVPADVGVRVNAKTFLADFQHFGPSGLEKRGGELWVTPGFEQSRRRASITVTAVLGKFDVVRQ